VRLKPPQRSILAAFSDFKQAEQAAAELKENGFETVQIDEVRQDPGEPTDRIHNLLTGDVPGLGNVVLGTDFAGRDAAVLKAADPSASGMADGSKLEMTRHVLVTVVVEEKDYPRAEAIIRKHGGAY
jgi:hypothetical protein